MKILRGICGCKVTEEDERLKTQHYKEQEILNDKLSVSKTQVSNIL